VPNPELFQSLKSYRLLGGGYFSRSISFA
jgi:hypothetical protein